MKKILCLIALLFILTNAYATKKHKHEFGIGLGYNECRIGNRNGEKEDDYTRRAIEYQMMGSPFQDGYSTYSNQYFQTSFTSPALYYQYELSKKLKLRLSFQMSTAKSVTEIPAYFQFPRSVLETRMRKYDLNLGFFSTLFQTDRTQLSLGIGLNSDPLVEKNKTISEGVILEQSKNSTSNLVAFSSLSYCISLDQCINLKYDFTFLTDAITFYIRPMNRLSINFKF